MGEPWGLPLFLLGKNFLFELLLVQVAKVFVTDPAEIVRYFIWAALFTGFKVDFYFSGDVNLSYFSF